MIDTLIASCVFFIFNAFNFLGSVEVVQLWQQKKEEGLKYLREFKFEFFEPVFSDHDGVTTSRNIAVVFRGRVVPLRQRLAGEPLVQQLRPTVGRAVHLEGAEARAAESSETLAVFELSQFEPDLPGSDVEEV